jgi:pSer/pThr/pTyr-binding forkhead associated (FHA) protein
MPAQLVGLTDGVRILVDKPILLLGRDSECDIQFESRKISRRHCCVALVGEQLVVRDLGSTNGIRINGVRILEGSLKAGDEFAVGNHRYLVSWDALPPGQERNRVKKVRDPNPVKMSKAEPEANPISRPEDEPIRLAESAVVPMSQLKEEKSTSPNPPPAQATPPTGKPPFQFDIVPDEIELSPVTDDFPFLSPRQRQAQRNDKKS